MRFLAVDRNRFINIDCIDYIEIYEKYHEDNKYRVMIASSRDRYIIEEDIPSYKSKYQIVYDIMNVEDGKIVSVKDVIK